jgi:hypothetical protein
MEMPETCAPLIPLGDDGRYRRANYCDVCAGWTPLHVTHVCTPGEARRLRALPPPAPEELVHLGASQINEP